MVKRNIKDYLNRAIEFKNKGDYKKALKIMLDIDIENGDYDKKHVIYGLIGGTFFLAEEYESATEYYDKCLNINSSSTACSSGKFHCLLELGRTTDALEEMQRFLTLNPNPKKDFYKEILEDLLENDLNNEIFIPYRSFIIDKSKEFGVFNVE